MQKLYELGARKVLVTGTGPLGCVPAQLATSGSSGQCAEGPQQAAAIFNPLLIEMAQGLNSELGSNIFITANAFEMHMDFITDPQHYGLLTYTKR